MSFLRLFEGYGIELEYMIVDRDSLAIRSISDEILKSAAGHIISDFEDGEITWSNELVLHVLELKTTGPAGSLAALGESFARSLTRVNSLLEPLNARLMPTAMHPLVHPSQTTLWPHDNNEIYESYNRIFNCSGHGWSNVQSMHINLPFSNDDEFVRLHCAIRFLLPILPALAASSPIVEGRITGQMDNRLLFYQENQRRVPSIAGLVIPETVNSIRDYQEKVLARIYSDIAPHDPDQILQQEWLNSRGAIARFDRQTIEIRVLDVQEAPLVDIAIADLLSTLLKLLVRGELVSLDAQKQFDTKALKTIFDEGVRSGEMAQLNDPAYAKAWSVDSGVTQAELWRSILAKVPKESFMSTAHSATIEKLLRAGSLSTRIKRALGTLPNEASIRQLYGKLCNCLSENRMFEA